MVNENKNFKNELNKIKKAVLLGNLLGLEVHAGHGLTFKSAKILSKVKGIKEFNIGHFLIGEAIYLGLGNTIKIFRKIQMHFRKNYLSRSQINNCIFQIYFS